MSGNPTTSVGGDVLSGAPSVQPDDLRVSVMTPLGLGGRGGIDRQMEAIDQELRKHPELHVRARFHPTRGHGPLIYSAWLMAVASLELIRLKLTGQVDVVHINLAHTGSVYRKVFLGAVCQRLGIPYVVHLHGSMFRQSWEGAAPWLSRALRRFFEQSAFTLVLGKVWADFVVARAPGVTGRIVVTPSASSDYPDQGEPPGRPVRNILFMGRLGPRKGVPELLSALKMLEGQDDWRAVLSGDGEIDETRQMAEKLGLTGRVAIPGWVSGTEHDRLFREADIVVLPSLNENLPMVIVEAFARGVPVVTTPVGSISDIVIDDVSGLLVAPGNADALAAALRRLLGDEALRKRLARGGREMFKARLDIEGYTERLVGIWRRAARGET